MEFCIFEFEDLISLKVVDSPPPASLHNLYLSISPFCAGCGLCHSESESEFRLPIDSFLDILILCMHLPSYLIHICIFLFWERGGESDVDSISICSCSHLSVVTLRNLLAYLETFLCRSIYVCSYVSKPSQAIGSRLPLDVDTLSTFPLN